MKDSQGWLAIVPWACVALVIGLSCSGCTAEAQLVKNPDPIVYLLPNVRDTLAKHYRATQKDSLSLEFGACLAYDVIPLSDEARLYRVTKARFPVQQGDIARGPDGRIWMYRLFMWCLKNEIHVHSHSRHQCTGILGQDCLDFPDLWRQPSAKDSVAVQGIPVALIQYRENDFLPYFPDSILSTALNHRQTPPKDSSLRRDLYLTGLMLIPTINLIGKVDVDEGGYAPQWDQMSVFHLTAGFTLESVGTSLGLADKLTVPAVCATGVLWEASQAYADWRDAVATCSGAVASALLRRAFR